MKRYIYVLLAVTLLLGGCSYVEVDSPSPSSSAEDGTITVGFKLSMQSSTELTVETRSALVGNESNIIDGWAVVFGADPADDKNYGDDSPLIQKVAFKTDSEGNAFVTFSEYNEGFCYIRLLANLTDETRNEIYDLVSQKDIENGIATGSPSTFFDYKHLDVGLDGYYASATAPDAASLRSDKSGYPCSSPGFEMEGGLTEDSLEALNDTNVTMVPVGSKLEVTSKCDFALGSVRLYNGAKRALMRSTVLEDDGVTEITSLPLPTNLGGVNYNFQWITASNNTTASTPIYFFPNEGDDPYSINGTAEENALATYDNEDESAVSDPINGINPTYVIIKGRAAGYDVDGYYKISIHCAIHEETRDILRNGDYEIQLLAVDNPGYATEAEAIAGPANNISYDVVVGVGSDSRNETVVSHSGRFSMELNATKIYIKGYGTTGVTGSFTLFVTDNDAEENYNTPAVEITGSTGITISNGTIAAGANGSYSETEVSFTAAAAGDITIRCGDLLYTIPVEYDSTPFTKENKQFAINGSTIFSGSNTTGLSNETSIAFTEYGMIPENTTYAERDLAAQVYTTDLGAIKVYCKQASDFYLTNGGNVVSAESGHVVAYTAKAEIWGNDSTEQYLTDDVYTSDGVVTSNDDVYYYSAGVVSNMSVTTSDETDYDAAGVTPDVNFDIDDYLKSAYTASSNQLRLYASPITNYDLDTPASSYDGGFLLAPVQVATTITLTNSAGDTKEYTLLQKLYPPVYLVTNSYGSTKEYNMNSGSAVTDNACIFALNMWNYDDTDSNYKWGYNWTSVTDDSTWGLYDSDEDMKDQLVTMLFTKEYLSNYNWSYNSNKGTSSSGQTISGKDIYGNTETFSSVEELNSIGGDEDADAIIGVVRNTDYGTTSDKATGVVVFTITDKFGEVYTTTKTIQGV